MISTKCGAATDTGLVRRQNEDSLLAQFPLFVVADGMGGHAAGEVASGITVDSFQELLTSGRSLEVGDLAETIDAANRRVFENAASKDSRGMGTTVVGLALISERGQQLWLVFNVGDSRLYRWMDHSLTQVTVDHSEVQELIDDGSLSSNDARNHPNRHIITRAIGIEEVVEPDFWLLPAVSGERFLLSSDGLSSEVSDEVIGSVLAEEPVPEQAAQRLIDLALAAGGHDNVTVVVIDVSADAQSLEDEDTARGLNAEQPANERRVLIDHVPTESFLKGLAEAGDEGGHQ